MGGRVRYAFMPNLEERPDPPVACSRMLKEFGRGLAVAQNLVLLRCDAGTAPGMGRVIDELDHELILGCVAGDDTVLVVSKDKQAAESVCDYLTELGG
jgi:transcriptional regulator of arginine metabolism